MNQPFTKSLSFRLLAVALLAVAGATIGAAAETNAIPTGKAPDKFAEIFGDAVIAKGKGVEVKRSQLDEIVINYKASLAARGQVAQADQIKLLEVRVLEDLIGTQLLLNNATDADKAKGKEQFETALQKLKTDGKLTDAEFDDKLNAQLRSQSMTREQWTKRQLDQAVILAVLERELKINVTDADLKKYYDEHPSQFEEPEKVRVSHILISTKDPADTSPDPSMRRDLPESQKQAKRKQIEEILKRAKSGEDFTKLAKEFSDDPGVKENNGEYTFSRSDAFVPEFKAAAFSLNTNQISEVVTTLYGYHILKLTEKMPAKKVELAKVSDRLKQVLKQQEVQKLLPDYTEKLKKEANVEILDEKLKAAADELARLPKLDKTETKKPEGKK